MTETDRNDNTTRIRPSSSPSEQIPSRYQASVVVLKGHAQGMEYLIDRTSAVIGREKHAQIYLKDPLISREHAVITFQGGAFVLKDLGSTNGTVMNGISIKQVDLRHGDTFRVGDTVLQFVLEDTGQTSTYELT
jgi:pSer/pThr/pTyr-binding forkhead associated (FHA) protein